MQGILKGSLPRGLRPSFLPAYCGLCRGLVRAAGWLPGKLFLTYDIAYLLLLGWTIRKGAESAPSLCSGRCFFRQCNPQAEFDCRDELVRLATALSLAGAYSRIADWLTETQRGLKRAALEAARRWLEGLILSGDYHSLLEDAGLSPRTLDELALLQDSRERSLPSLSLDGPGNLDLLMDVTGLVGERSFLAMARKAGAEENRQNLMAEAGRICGNLLYVWDAALDRRRDALLGRFNGIQACLASGQRGITEELKQRVALLFYRLGAILRQLPDGYFEPGLYNHCGGVLGRRLYQAGLLDAEAFWEGPGLQGAPGSNGEKF